jgi:hypothetical protein
MLLDRMRRRLSTVATSGLLQKTFTTAGMQSRLPYYQLDPGLTKYLRYVWLPADINDHTGSFTIDWHDLYTIDTKTGKVTYPEGTVYEAEHGVVTGSAYATICVGFFLPPRA